MIADHRFLILQFFFKQMLGIRRDNIQLYRRLPAQFIVSHGIPGEGHISLSIMFAAFYTNQRDIFCIFYYNTFSFLCLRP